MKRIGFLWDQIVDYDNIALAHQRARRGKTYQRQVREVEGDLHERIIDLMVMLERGEYRTSEYTKRLIFERGKEREIFRLPYWPDRVVHHAIAQVLAPVWRGSMIRHTYASIPGRGIHDAAKIIRHQLRTDPDDTRYCLKMDVRKFYPSIPHDGLMDVMRRQIKDRRVLTLLEEVIRSIDVSAPGVGVPIGNYLSQWFANVYLSPTDHRFKELYRVKYYHRYCDDIVVLGPHKRELHELRRDFETWLRSQYGLDLKANWQVFPVADRGIDFVGYRMFPEKTLLRKGTKKRMAAKLSMPAIERSPGAYAAALRAAPAYDGWTQFGSTHDLREKLLVPAKSITQG
jgi:RNA-directed DNA polymerase